MRFPFIDLHDKCQLSQDVVKCAWSVGSTAQKQCGVLLGWSPVEREPPEGQGHVAAMWRRALALRLVAGLTVTGASPLPPCGPQFLL